MTISPFFDSKQPDLEVNRIFFGTASVISTERSLVSFGPYTADIDWSQTGTSINSFEIKPCDILKFAIKSITDEGKILVNLLEHIPLGKPEYLPMPGFGLEPLSEPVVKEPPKDVLPNISDVFDGTITNCAEFGVFVKFGIFTGLAHTSNFADGIALSDLDWGHKAKVIILKKHEDGRFSLGLLETEPCDGSADLARLHPSLDTETEYYGIVSKTAQYGIKVRFADVSGLAHANSFPANVKVEDIQLHDSVKVKIRGIRPDGKIGLELIQHNKDISDVLLNDGDTEHGVFGLKSATMPLVTQEQAQERIAALLISSTTSNYDDAARAVSASLDADWKENFREAANIRLNSGQSSCNGREISEYVGGRLGMAIGGIPAREIPLHLEKFWVLNKMWRMMGTGEIENHPYQDPQRWPKGAQELISTLQQSNATFFINKTMTSHSGFESYVDLLITKGSRCYGILFKTWRGSITISPSTKKTDDSQSQAISTTSNDRAYINVAMKDRDFEPAFRNPSRSIGGFLYEANRFLRERNSLWNRTPIIPLVVFPDENLDICRELADDPKFVRFSQFVEILKEHPDSPSSGPRWMHDNIVDLPSLDSVVDRRGFLHSGKIENTTIDVLVGGGLLTIPMRAILKVEVEHGASAQHDDTLIITMKNLAVIRGLSTDATLTLDRNSSTKEIGMWEIASFAPRFYDAPVTSASNPQSE